MNVRELIAKLQEIDPDMPVHTIGTASGLWYPFEAKDVRVVRSNTDETGAWKPEGPYPRVEIE